MVDLVNYQSRAKIYNEGTDYAVETLKGLVEQMVERYKYLKKYGYKNMEECKSSMKVEWLPIIASMYGITKEELLEEYLNERWLRNDRCRKKTT